MTTLKRLAASAAFCVAALGMAAPSFATTLVVDTGWQYDQIDAKNAASVNSPITFTVPTGDTYLFSLSDGFLTGDVYKVVIDGVISSVSTFSDYSTPFDNSTGPAASYFSADWLNDKFSHLQLSFGAGSYSLMIYGNGKGGLPAGFGERLDSGDLSLGIPEPATWLTMLLGFGGLGIAMRNRRKQALTA